MTLKQKLEHYYSVLIVDDDPSNRLIIQRYLRKEGFLVLSASNAAEAFSTLEFIVPDAILLDYQMPKLDGIETLRLIREKNKQSVVILMTAYSSDEVELGAILNEADDFLAKPLKFKLLGDIIHAHIVKRHKMLNNAKQASKTNSFENKIKIDEKDIFSHFLILNESIPVFSLGSWGSISRIQQKNRIRNEDQEILISGLLSAIKDFSRVVFGENVGHISMGNYQIMLHQTGKYLLSLVISTPIYQFLEDRDLLRVVKKSLHRISHLLLEEHNKSNRIGTIVGLPSFLEHEIRNVLAEAALSIITVEESDK